MAERKTKINYQGGEHEGVEVHINSIHEGVNTYDLADGTVLSMRSVMVGVIRLDGVRTDQGDPTYVVKSQNIVSASVPEQLRKKMEE